MPLPANSINPRINAGRFRLSTRRPTLFASSKSSNSTRPRLGGRQIAGRLKGHGKPFGRVISHSNRRGVDPVRRDNYSSSLELVLDYSAFCEFLHSTEH